MERVIRRDSHVSARPPLPFAPGKARAMPRTIYCPDCGVSLNVPDDAAGRRLKCPKCGCKFTADGGAAHTGGPAQSNKPHTTPGKTHSPARDSSITLPTTGNSSHGDADLPTATGSLRELFDDASLLPDTPRTSSKAPMSAAPESDAMSLFQDDAPTTPRRNRNLAEGRAKARRCPTCGTVVPQGMSLCGTCGLDLDTGARVDLMEDIDPTPTIRRAGPPIGVWMVGLISMAAAVIFSIISLVKMSAGESAYALLLCVCLFGVFAAVRFLQSKSVRLLLIALTLGAFVNVVALLILPIYNASMHVDVQERKIDVTSVEDENIKISNVADKLNTTELSWGIAILVTYAAVAVYLNSPPIRRHFGS